VKDDLQVPPAQDPVARPEVAGAGLAARLRVASGDIVRLTTKRDSVLVPVDVTDMMQPGHISLPNGFGVDFPDGDGTQRMTGTPPNELTASEDRDPFAGTPWHKHVPARLELV
jgi:formate dehydrogenase